MSPEEIAQALNRAFEEGFWRPDVFRWERAWLRPQDVERLRAAIMRSAAA